MLRSWPSIRSKPLELVFEIPANETQEFWEGLKEGEIKTTRCIKCGRLHFPPVADCPECKSSQMKWEKLEGEGKLETFTHVIARPTSFQQSEPYTIAIGKLGDGVKVLAWLREVEVTEVEIGMNIKLTVGKNLEGEPFYYFVPA